MIKQYVSLINKITNQDMESHMEEQLTTLMLNNLDETLIIMDNKAAFDDYIYDDFNENISEEFRSAIQSMDEDVDDFGLTLSQISLDNVLTEQENNEFISRVDATLEECINAINEKQNTIQSGLQEAFSVDGVLDDNDAAILNWWNERGQTEKEEAQKLADLITRVML